MIDTQNGTQNIKYEYRSYLYFKPPDRPLTRHFTLTLSSFMHSLYFYDMLTAALRHQTFDVNISIISIKAPQTPTPPVFKRPKQTNTEQCSPSLICEFSLWDSSPCLNTCCLVSRGAAAMLVQLLGGGG